MLHNGLQTYAAYENTHSPARFECGVTRCFPMEQVCDDVTRHDVGV